MSTTKLAYCGLNCSSCPIYLASLETDQDRQQSMRGSIIDTIEEVYGVEFHPNEISDCDGCRTNTERVFVGCSNCEIRKCAREKTLEFCACCDQYSSCYKLTVLFLHEPAAEIRVDETKTKYFSTATHTRK